VTKWQFYFDFPERKVGMNSGIYENEIIGNQAIIQLIITHQNKSGTSHIFYFELNPKSLHLRPQKNI